MSTLPAPELVTRGGNSPSPAPETTFLYCAVTSHRLFQTAVDRMPAQKLEKSLTVLFFFVRKPHKHLKENLNHKSTFGLYIFRLSSWENPTVSVKSRNELSPLTHSVNPRGQNVRDYLGIKLPTSRGNFLSHELQSLNTLPWTMIFHFCYSKLQKASP